MVERDLFFEDILDSITSHVAVLDDSSRIIAVNTAWKSFARENGCTDENSYLGVDYLAVCEAAFRHDNDESAIAALWGILEVIEGSRTAFSLEYPCHSPERKRWFVMHASRMRKMQRGVVIAHDDITTRRLAEEALHKNEVKFRAIADYTVDWESWITPEGRLVWVNPAVEKLTGYSVDDCLAMPGYPLPIIVEEDRAFMRRKLHEAMQGSRGDGVEFRIAHKDGSVSWGEISWQSIFDQQSHPLGYRSSVRDITERKQVEETLRRSEERYRAVVENQTEVISRFKADGTIIFVNDVYCRFFGKNQDELMGFRWQPLAATEDIPMIEHRLRTLSPDNPVVVIENRVYSGTGLLRWMQFVNRGFFNAQGRLEEIQSVGRDITDRKMAEQTLRESEARMRAIFEYSLASILITAPDGRIFAANPAACRLFGRTEEDIIKAGRSGLVDRKDPRLNRLLDERKEKGYAVGEMNFIRADGTHFPALISSAIYETEEEPRTCLVIQDLSDRKQAEERIHDFSRNLLSVREEEKHNISIALHHDVGSITVSVLARMQAAEEDLRAGRYKEALLLLKESRRLFEKSVKKLKELAIELRPPDLDVLGLPTALRQLIHQITHKTQLKIRFSDTSWGNSNHPEIQTVFFRIAQECLSNVIKHAQASLVQIRLSSSKHQLRLSIADDGKGFDPARPLVIPGKHLGLQSMQEMIEGLGGTFKIASAPGKGLKTTVTVPTE